MESLEVWTSRMFPMSSTSISPQQWNHTFIELEGKLFLTSATFFPQDHLLGDSKWFTSEHQTLMSFFSFVEQREQTTRALLCLSSLTPSLGCCQKWRKLSLEVNN